MDKKRKSKVIRKRIKNLNQEMEILELSGIHFITRIRKLNRVIRFETKRMKGLNDAESQ